MSVLQGYHGAKSPKPTQLLFSGIPKTWIQDLEVALRSQVLPKAVSIGKTEAGWSTSPLKEYPPGFCVFLSKVFAQWLERKSCLPRREVTKDLTELLKLCVQLEEEGAEERPIGKDFYEAGNACNYRLNLECEALSVEPCAHMEMEKTLLEATTVRFSQLPLVEKTLLYLKKSGCCWGCDFYLKMLQTYHVLQCFWPIRVPNPK